VVASRRLLAIADVVEQLAALRPDHHGVSLNLAHSRLRLIPERCQLFP